MLPIRIQAESGIYISEFCFYKNRFINITFSAYNITILRA